MSKLMYLGPSKPYGLPIRKNAILAGPPEAVFPQSAEVFREHPLLRKLFVPVESIPQAKGQLAIEGSTLATIYKTVSSESREAANV